MIKMRDIRFRQPLIDSKTKDFVGFHFWGFGCNGFESPVLHLRGLRGKYADTANLSDAYTGLLDKHGKEIYEGDYIRFFDDDNHTHLIEYRGGCFGYHPDRFFGIIPFGINDHFEWGITNQSMKVEVIGNMYENPGLLKD